MSFNTGIFGISVYRTSLLPVSLEVWLCLAKREQNVACLCTFNIRLHIPIVVYFTLVKTYSYTIANAAIGLATLSGE